MLMRDMVLTAAVHVPDDFMRGVLGCAGPIMHSWLLPLTLELAADRLASRDHTPLIDVRHTCGHALCAPSD
jgi:hypothetical protein